MAGSFFKVVKTKLIVGTFLRQLRKTDFQGSFLVKFCYWNTQHLFVSLFRNNLWRYLEKLSFNLLKVILEYC